ncbi:MAG: type II toxin-antitoxin system ParD family antitoxin [Alphaproteobacteria bacterium]|nr:type II toxin-antitoxin system ParD family antitoxin [Alphaproteobacteria bacterium]
MIRKTITLTDQQDSWIKSQIATGQYGNDSELIRELIRERQSRLNELELIRAKLVEAELRGFTDQSIPELKAEFKAKAMRDGKL